MQMLCCSSSWSFPSRDVFQLFFVNSFVFSEATSDSLFQISSVSSGSQIHLSTASLLVQCSVKYMLVSMACLLNISLFWKILLCCVSTNPGSYSSFSFSSISKAASLTPRWAYYRGATSGSTAPGTGGPAWALQFCHSRFRPGRLRAAISLSSGVLIHQMWMIANNCVER